MPRHMRWAWRILLAMMLTAAAWSVSGELIGWGMPDWLAYPLSLMFDSAGLLSAGYAQRAIERNTAALLPRVAVFAFVGMSGLVNYAHGLAIGGAPAAYGFASLSAFVELLFELHRRDIRDAQRAALGLVPMRLPRVPVLAWIMFPARSWATIRDAIGARLDAADNPGPDTPGHTDTADTDTAGHADTDTADTSGRPDTGRSTVRRLPVRRTDTGQPTIADTIRVLRRIGTDTDEDIVRGVRQVHGPDIKQDTIVRTLRRVRDEGTAAGREAGA